MISFVFLITFLMGGCFIIRCLLPERSPLTRLWLGLSLGLFLMMWLPALAAFPLRFTLAGHWVSLAALLLICAGSYFARGHALAPWDEKEKSLLYQCLFIALPLTLLGGYLQYTHNLRVGADGAFYVGQSTYGDLALHTSIITGLPGAAFPPDYSILPGERLSYPFLTDALSASLYLGGFNIQWALNLPGTLMMALCYTGVLIIGRELTSGKRAAVLATLLFFLNGGLGFLYTFDQSAGEVTERIGEVLNGYYQTPTNMPEPNNLRWSNVICDLMIPQRTLLGGWAMVLPCFYLLFIGFRGKWEIRPLCLLGVWGGGLPMIHTHSFTALALCSLGLMVYDLWHEKDRWQTFKPYLIYGAVACVLSVPQLFIWTFQQAGGSDHFLTLQFNWVNNPGGQGMRDLYLWFYLKNIGLPVLLILCALIEKNKQHRRIASGAFVIFIAAEFIRFQPNEYDNNKLFYLWYLLSCYLAADYAFLLWDRLKGLRGRWVLAGFTGVCLFLSAGLTIARECVSNYQVYSARDVACAEFIKKETPEQSVFITGTQHLNPVSSLAGRTIICGPDLWLYYHGFSTGERQTALKDFYTDPQSNLSLIDRYGADYIYISAYEFSNYRIDLDAFDELFDKVYEEDSTYIYATGRNDA